MSAVRDKMSGRRTQEEAAALAGMSFPAGEDVAVGTAAVGAKDRASEADTRRPEEVWLRDVVAPSTLTRTPGNG